jgi:hypothetical protein
LNQFLHVNFDVYRSGVCDLQARLKGGPQRQHTQEVRSYHGEHNHAKRFAPKPQRRADIDR